MEGDLKVLFITWEMKMKGRTMKTISRLKIIWADASN